MPEEPLERPASDGTIEENFEEELAKAPVVYTEVRGLKFLYGLFKRCFIRYNFFQKRDFRENVLLIFVLQIMYITPFYTRNACEVNF